MIKKTEFIKGDQVLHSKSEFISETMTEEGYRVPSHKLGARVFSDVTFPEQMSFADIGRMTILSKLMTGNMLGYRHHGEVRAYSEGQLHNILKMSRYRGHEFIAKMLDLKVMKLVNGEYWINPAYFLSTGQRRISLPLWAIFREELKPVLPDWVYWEYARQWHTIHPYAEVIGGD